MIVSYLQEPYLGIDILAPKTLTLAPKKKIHPNCNFI